MATRTTVQAGHAGQHQSEDDDVRPEGPQPVHPLLAGRGGVDVMVLAAQGQGPARSAVHVTCAQYPRDQDHEESYQFVTFRARSDHMATTS